MIRIRIYACTDTSIPMYLLSDLKAIDHDFSLPNHIPFRVMIFTHSTLRAVAKIYV